jgi:hypothetical protein
MIIKKIAIVGVIVRRQQVNKIWISIQEYTKMRMTS